MSSFKPSWWCKFIFTNDKFNIYLPTGQICVLHLLLSTDCPVHDLPPFAGGGLIHERLRTRNPPPHDREHLLQGLHCE